MKRAAMVLAVLGVLCISAGQVWAHDHHKGHGKYYHGHRGPVVVRPAVVVPPPVVVRPRVVYPPYYGYGYGYYDPCPSFGFRYNGPRVSVGVGF